MRQATGAKLGLYEIWRRAGTDYHQPSHFEIVGAKRSGC
jgi:hypothetical protein